MWYCAKTVGVVSIGTARPATAFRPEIPGMRLPYTAGRERSCRVRPTLLMLLAPRLPASARVPAAEPDPVEVTHYPFHGDRSALLRHGQHGETGPR